MKILVKIKNEKLYIINRKKLDSDHKNMLNTNIINNDELVFNDEYITKNYKLVYNFFNELIKSYNINTLSFQNLEIATLFIPIINKLKNISNIYFASDEALTYKITEALIKCNDLKNISAFNLADYMFEIFDKNGIVAESRNEILFSSNFMSINELNSYSSIFYKNVINLDLPFANADFDDFLAFCNINKHLKVIHTNTLNRFDLENIIDILKNTNHSHLKILIHGDIHDLEMINYLKKHKKKIKNKYKITLKLKYSEKYIKNNIADETNNTILRYCGILILFIVLLSFCYVGYDNYKSMLKVSKIQEKIEDYIINVEDEKQEENLNIKNYYLLSLKSINKDIVGWLKVNNTNIDYAVTQTNNNSYYLNYNLYKEKDANGWIFMDYENNPNLEDDNTIIYGHNRFLNGVMFGTLNKTLYKNWYTNKDNQTIELKTINGNYKYKIFSIYTILTTSDYIQVNFDTESEKLELFNTLKERSIYDFNVNVDQNSKILTLSTCNSDTTRLVVHGVLISVD